MNIGIDIRVLLSPVRTGVGEYTFELLHALFQTDRANQYFLFYNSYRDVSAVLPKWEYPNVHVVGTRWPNKALNTFLTLFRKPTLETLFPISDIDYFFSPNLNFTSLFPKTKHILTIHDLSFELFPQCYSWKRRVWHSVLRPKRQCEAAHLILVPSEHTKRDVVSMYKIPAEKICVVTPGVSLMNQEFGISHRHSGTPPRGGGNQGVREKYDLPEKFVLFLGTIEPRKNISGIIEGYVEYRKKRKYPMDLVIAGPLGWKTRKILKKIKQTPGVKYIGYVAPEDKDALYRAASVFVYPSLYEGFGFPVLEAFRAGTPVITSNRSSLPEVAGEAAYLVDPYSATDIASGMERVGHDESVRKWFVREGRERIKDFSWGKTAGAWLEHIV